jgi:hypothetical protein
MKKNNRFKTFRFVMAFAICVVLGSCTGNDSKNPLPANDIQSVTDTSSHKTDKQEVQESVSYNLPSPLQIAALFKKSGLVFLEGITNTQNDASKYSSNYSKSLNLGVYGADLAYCVLNKQRQQALNYMKAATQLSSSLGMTSIFEEGNFVKRFEKNIDNEDSLRNIIAETQMATDTYLEDNDQLQVSAIAFSGAWVETMYIGSKVFEKSKKKGLNEKITEQMTILSKIIRVLKSRETKDAEITTLITDLNGLLDIYNNFDSVKKSKTESKENEPEVVVSLNEQEMGDLVKKIIELRNKFVNS